MPTAKLLVHDLDSADAERRLARALEGVPGVFGVVASCREHCVEVDFEDDEVTVEQLVSAANAAGFRATLAG